jgi:hypothetical protein
MRRMSEMAATVTDRVPTTEEIIAKLQLELHNLDCAIHSMLAREAHLDEMKRLLRESEIDCLLMGLVEGKNAEIRQAQLERQTADSRARVQEATEKYREARMWVEYQKEVLSTWRAIAYLLAEHK